MFDNISKFLVTEYSTDFASWLLGREIPLTTLNPTELNLEPIRADAVVFMTDKEAVLQQVVERIQQVGDRRQKSNLTAATGILAGLELSQTIIRRLIRSDIMQESVIYQEILREGEARGEARGRSEEGKALISRLLTHKLGNLPVELLSQVNNLSIEQLEALAEALLNFSGMTDLEVWLQEHHA